MNVESSIFIYKRLSYFSYKADESHESEKNFGSCAEKIILWYTKA